MDRLERKIHKLIKDSDPEGKIRMWQKLVREHIGCQCCQHYHKRKKCCKLGHQDIIEERQGLPCDDMLPTKLKGLSR